MLANAIVGLLGCGLLCLAVAATVLRLHALPVRARYPLVMAALAVVLAPIGDLSIAAAVRGVTGDLSAATLALAVGACFARLMGRPLFEHREVNALLWLVAAAALFLYPFALGWTPFDPYALGFGSITFVAALLLVTLTAWRMGSKLVVLVVLAAAVAYLAGAYESRNLWDYLVDPLVALYAAVRLSAGEIRKHFPRRQS